jgi:hypothetical protein
MAQNLEPTVLLLSPGDSPLMVAASFVTFFLDHFSAEKALFALNYEITNTGKTTKLSQQRM